MSLPPSTAAEKLILLAQSHLFQHLSAEEINELDRITTVTPCPPGCILYRPGEQGGGLFLLMSGCVQLYHLSSDGRKLITATLRDGDCFGELALIGHQKHSSFAEAVEES